MKKKGLQRFSKEYIESCKGMTPDQILEFIDNFQKLHLSQKEKCQQINMKIEPSLLKAFKQRAELERIPYQTLIKKLMRDWLQHGGSIC